jgi:hypothetical protein
MTIRRQELKFFTHRKSILSILLSLIILAALLVPAMPVYAAADWPLQIIGYTTASLTQAQFASLATQYPSTVITEVKDGVTTEWQGVALWRLVAMADGGPTDTLNTAIAGSISVQGASDPTYASTALTSAQWYGTDGANKDNVIVANQYRTQDTDLSWTAWGPLAASKYPAKITGTVGGALLGGSNRPGQLISLTLQNLPAVAPALSISPASQSVNDGDTFTIDVNIDNPSTASGSWQTDVDFDASKLTAVSVTEGSYLSGVGATTFGAGAIDNTGGHITNIYSALQGTGSKTGSGTLCTVNFTAKAGASGSTDISLANITVGDIQDPPAAIPGVTATSGTVNITGPVPSPDLIIQDSSAAAVAGQADQYTISYTIKNNGSADAAASTTSISIDGVSFIINCPALAAGATDSQTTVAQTISGSSDSIVITADSANAVTEGDETNNTASFIYALVSPNDVIVDGTIASVFTFTPPTAVSWNPLTPGDPINSALRNMNVTANQSWQITVQASNSGYMTKYNGTYGATHLQERLYIDASGESAFYFDGNVQILAEGSPADLTNSYSRDIPVTFYQRVFFSDPGLAAGYTYHIVISFIATPTY